MKQLPVIRNVEDAESHSPNDPALVEVPGAFVKSVLFLAAMVTKPTRNPTAKAIKSLARGTPVIQSRKAAEGLDPHKPALVRVPGRQLLPVVKLLNLIGKPGKSNVGRAIQALEALEASGPRGLIVTNVAPTSTAAAAGMVRGDILLRYNGKDLVDALGLKQLAEATDPATRVVIEAIRGADPQKIEAQGGRLGITVQQLASSAPNVH